MDCNNTKELLGALIDNEVTPEEREQLLSHIAECNDCKNEYETVKAIKKDFKELDKRLDGALAEGVMKKVYAEAYPKKKTFKFRYLGTAAAALVVVGLFAMTRFAPMNEKAEEAKDSENITYNNYQSATLPEASSQDGNAEGKVTFECESNDILLMSPPVAEAMPAESITIEGTVYDSVVEEAVNSNSVKSDIADYYLTAVSFRALNSISDTTALIYVEGDIETLAPLFGQEAVEEAHISTDLEYAAAVEILNLNSIEIKFSDVPESATDTTIIPE